MEDHETKGGQAPNWGQENSKICDDGKRELAITKRGRKGGGKKKKSDTLRGGGGDTSASEGRSKKKSCVVGCPNRGEEHKTIVCGVGWGPPLCSGGIRQ